MLVNSQNDNAHSHQWDDFNASQQPRRWAFNGDDNAVGRIGSHHDRIPYGYGRPSMGLELLSSDEVSALLTIDVSLESEALPFRSANIGYNLAAMMTKAAKMCSFVTTEKKFGIMGK